MAVNLCFFCLNFLQLAAFLNGNLENIDYLTQEIHKISSTINIHLGKYEPINLDEFKKNKKYLVFSGIGNHQTFVSMIKKNGLEILKDLEFSDHTSAIAWLLDPAIKKLFIEKDQSLIIIIPS